MRILMVARRARDAAAASSALQATGHDVTLIVPAGGDDAAASGALIAGEYPPVMAGVDETARHIQANIAMFERAAAVAAATPPDLIHAFGDSIAHCAVSLRRAFRVPLIATPLRSNDPLSTNTGAWLKSEADRIVVASRRAADAAIAAGAAPQAIDIVRAGPGHAKRLERAYRQATRDEPLHAVETR